MAYVQPVTEWTQIITAGFAFVAHTVNNGILHLFLQLKVIVGSVQQTNCSSSTNRTQVSLVYWWLALNNTNNLETRNMKITKPDNQISTNIYYETLFPIILYCDENRTLFNGKCAHLLKSTYKLKFVLNNPHNSHNQLELYILNTTFQQK